MSTLLVQSCSKSKKQAEEPTAAIDLYSGYFFKIIKKSKRDETQNSDIDIGIVSAKYGFIDSDEKILPYDRRMDAQRAAELGPEIRKDLRNYIDNNGHRRVVINAGETYRKAIDGFDENLSVEIYQVSGGGLGLKGRALKRFLRGDESDLARVN